MTTDATPATASEFFSPITKEEMEELIGQLEGIPAIQNGADQVPHEIRKSLESSSEDLLKGYLLGAMHTSKAIAAMMQAAQNGDERSAGLIRLRQDLLTFLICRQLTSGGSRIILPK